MTDRPVVLLIVAALAVIAVGSLAAATYLLASGNPVEAAALVLGPGAASAGSLGTLLATTATRPKDGEA